jgi:hypothetical protein
LNELNKRDQMTKFMAEVSLRCVPLRGRKIGFQLAPHPQTIHSQRLIPNATGAATLAALIVIDCKTANYRKKIRK